MDCRGVDKGNDYSQLLPIVREKVKAIICLGVDNTKLLETFKPISEIIVETESIDEAVKIASKIAEKKDNVLHLQHVQVLIYLKAMKTGETNLSKQ